MKWKPCPALAALVIGLPCLIIFSACSSSNNVHEPGAAIIDQLGALLPNDAFLEQTAGELEEHGFTVDIYSGDAVNTDLYRKLPSYGYKVIVFRVHSGLLGIDPKVTNMTWLYTNEPYSKTNHLGEQLGDRLTYAKTREGAPWCFAINAEFIEKSMEGKFHNTAIIMMGCDALHLEDMAQAFIDKGASIYIGWDASVMLNYVDNATPFLLDKLCSGGTTVMKAMEQTMTEKGRDPKYQSFLKCYPAQSSTKTLGQLIQ